MTSPRPTPDSAVVYLPLDAVAEDPDQPRRTFEPKAVEELARSIESTVPGSERPWIDGLLHPVVVYPLAVHDDEDRPAYRLLVGARRFRAYQLRGWPEIPARIVDRPVSRAQMLLMQIAENNARENTSLWEDALALRAALEAWQQESPKGTRKEFARLCGRSGSWLSQTLRVTDVTGLARKAVVEGHVQHAETLRLFQKMPRELQESLLKLARVHRTPITAGLLRQHAPQKRKKAAPQAATDSPGRAAEGSFGPRRVQIWLAPDQIRTLLGTLGAPLPELEWDLPGALLDALTEETPPTSD